MDKGRVKTEAMNQLHAKADKATAQWKIVNQITWHWISYVIPPVFLVMFPVWYLMTFRKNYLDSRAAD